LRSSAPAPASNSRRATSSAGAPSRFRSASQDQVLVGCTPSKVATLDVEVFDYISQRSERPVAFMNQKVVDQRVIAIYFDKNRQVRRLANYGLQDGKIFDFISRTTQTSGQALSYLTPLFKLLSFN
jgi:outer membrane protein assembly factor BamE (lipoprotein component of BamABCDE complex)